MKRWFIVVFALVLIASASAPSIGKANAAATSDTVTVTVKVERLPDTVEVDLVNKTLPPVPRAIVDIPELHLTKTADEAGEATFVVKPGAYTFQAHAPGSANGMNRVLVYF